MSLCIFHTADWHLGHTLHGLDREYEHRQFLNWLLDRLEDAQADVLLIAGDVFDSANPPASAQAMFYSFLAQACTRVAGLKVVVIAGNHDSPARLEAPSPIFEALDVTVVGTLRQTDNQLETQPLIIPLKASVGETEAWCAALPFIRNSDLRGRYAPSGDELEEGVAKIYEDVFSAIESQRQSGQAVIAMGHCYMSGTRISELSERKILGGNQHALPVSLFPENITYVALGHLHLPQSVGGLEYIRYSGSPIPLSINERHYPHQVLKLNIEQGKLTQCESLKVPRSVEMLRFPDKGSDSLDNVKHLLETALHDKDYPPEQYPYVEVSIRLEKPDPGLRSSIESFCADKPLRLVRISTEYPGSTAGLACDACDQLNALTPENVFTLRYQQQFEKEPEPELLKAFHEIIQSVEESAE